MPHELSEGSLESPAGEEGVGALQRNSDIQTLQDTLRAQVLASFAQESSLPTQNQILQDELAKAVGRSIAIATHKEDATEQITNLTNEVIQASVKDFAELPYTLARARTRTRVLRNVGEIMNIVGLGDVDMAGILDNVDIRHMIQLVRQHVPEADSQEELSLLNIQKSLQEHTAPSDSFWSIINALDLLPATPKQFTEREMKFLEIMIQLGDATYAFSVLNDPNPRDGRSFDPNRLQVYPLTIQEFYDTKRQLGVENATTLTALNLLKDLRTNEGESLAPFLDQDEAGEVKMTISQIRKQQVFSEKIVDLVGTPINAEYSITAEGSDIGSWVRGTNNGVHPDVDLAFLNIPFDIHNSPAGLTNWGNVRTYGKDGEVGEGLVSIDAPTTIDEVANYDPRMARLIQATIDQFATIGTNVNMERMTAWNGGIMFSISLDHPTYAHVEFDVNLVSTGKDFGVEHKKQFNRYIADLIANDGEQRALILVEDIRRIKRLAKELSDNGNDKSKKIPGFLIESLFTSQSRPKTYEEVIRALQEYFPKDDVQRMARIHNQQTLLVGTFKKHSWPLWHKEADRLPEIMKSPSFTIGGYETLKKIVESEAQRLGITEQ